MSVDLGDLERLEADSIIGVAKPGRREVDAKPATKLQQRTCADGLGAQVAREERSAFSTSDVAIVGGPPTEKSRCWVKGWRT